MADAAVMASHPDLDDSFDATQLPSVSKYKSAGPVLKKIREGRIKRQRDEEAAQARRVKVEAEAAKRAQQQQQAEADEQEVKELEQDGQLLQDQLQHTSLQDTSVPEPSGYMLVLLTPQQVPSFDPARLCRLFPPLAIATATCDADSASSQDTQRTTQAELHLLAFQLQRHALIGSRRNDDMITLLFDAMVTSQDAGLARAAYDALLADFGVDSALYGPGFTLPPVGAPLHSPSHPRPNPPAISLFIKALDTHGYHRQPPPRPANKDKGTDSTAPEDEDEAALALHSSPPVHNLQLMLDMLAVFCRLHANEPLGWDLNPEQIARLVVRLLHVMLDERVGAQLRLELQTAVVQLVQMLREEEWEHTAGHIWTGVSQLSLQHRPFLNLLRGLGGLGCDRLGWLLEHLCVMLIRAVSPQLTRSNVILRPPAAATHVNASRHELKQLAGTPQKAYHALSSDVWRLNTLLASLDVLVLNVFHRHSGMDPVPLHVQEAVIWLLDWAADLLRVNQLIKEKKKTEVLRIEALQLEMKAVYDNICSFVSSQ